MVRLFFPPEVAETVRLEIRKRIPPLVLTNVMLFFYFFSAGGVRYLADPQHSGVFFLCLSITTMMFPISLLLIRLQHYRTASLLCSIALLLNVLWTGLLLPVDHPSDLYRFALYMVSAIVANSMITFTRWQIPVYVLASIVVYLVGTIYNYAAVLGGVQGELQRNFTTTIILIVAVNYVVFLIDRLHNQLLSELQAYTEDLELKVQQRTQELAEANYKLSQRQEEIERNLRLAQRIQLNILPSEKNYPKRKELSFSSRYRSLDAVGGDFFDIIRVGRNSYGFLIADVSGHGVAAAMVTTMAKVSFNTHVAYGVEPGDVCSMVNADLIRLLGEERSHYLTVYFGILDLETGVFSYTNAGHHPALLLHPHRGELLHLGNPNPFLGFFEDVQYRTEKFKLEPGHRLILYTDGLVEAMNPNDEVYDHGRLMTYALKNRSADLRSFVDGLLMDVQTFCGDRPPMDDQAVLAIDYLGRAEVRVEEAHAPGSPPSDWKQLIRLAVNYAKQNRLTEAEEIAASLYQKLMDKPKVAVLYVTLLLKSGKNDKARQVFEEAIQQHPNDPELAALKNRFSTSGSM